jgi:hypothetical protein
MKKNHIILLCLFIFGKVLQAQTPFATGNLAVYKIGNGTDTLSGAGFAVTIDEFTTAGTFVASHPLPITLIGVNKRLVASGTATSEGLLTRSADKRFLLATGYDTFPDPARLSITGSTVANVNRSVALLDSDGNIDLTTVLTDAYSGSNIRGAASSNGTDIWLAGTSTSTSGAGVRYTTRGSTTSTQLSTNVTNIRGINIFNGQLYCTSGSGAFKGISAVGTGLPTTSGQTIAVLPGFPNTTASGPDPFMFSINPAGTIAYVADNRSKLNGGGVQKWTNTGGTWNLAYTLDSGLSLGMRYITVDWSGTNATIYGVTSDAIVKNQPGNRIMKLTDVDSVSAFTVLAQAEPNFVFRGIAFTPEPGSTSTTYTFTGNGNWNLAANWANGAIPPNPLNSGAIIIDPAPGGQCLLNISQTIQAGASITVRSGKSLIVPGNLQIQ